MDPSYRHYFVFQEVCAAASPAPQPMLSCARPYPMPLGLTIFRFGLGERVQVQGCLPKQEIICGVVLYGKTRFLDRLQCGRQRTPKDVLVCIFFM